MDRKATARQTLAIMEQGAYQYEGRTIDLHSELEEAVRSSFLITPQQAEEQKSGRRIYQWRDGAGGESGGIQYPVQDFDSP